ncbi:3'-5' exonuclease [Actinokineospora cianjurensis]|uniref:DNA polymerase III epsilon subunit-like protein n=1 Tax=Actinokineospora cianjurensis TaxID=585224 RepID=A0A421AXA3_9PSEU|nr:3'-5' exonuclease [Actinokineospora cianjurensis]RLK54429.1 DNA polymerase III epsilon subunit-like protein [Actinokineospora cianjurensis]
MSKRTDPVLRYEDGLPVYRDGRAPEHLLTTTALRARRLSPTGLTPVARVSTLPFHKVCALYDSTQARPIKPRTARQRDALDKARHVATTTPCARCAVVRVPTSGGPWCPDCEPIAQQEHRDRLHRQRATAVAEHERMLAEDQAAAGAWAAAMLADPTMVALDTETTGLDGDIRVVEIAVRDRTGALLLDTLVNPGVPIPADATRVHSITDAMVAGAPRFAAVLPTLTEVLAGRRVIIYNAAYDTRVLRNELSHHHRAVDADTAPTEEWVQHPAVAVWMAGWRPECAMDAYAAWYGDWHHYWRDYRWQPLGGGHRAADDCAAVLRILTTMAGHNPAQPLPHLGAGSGAEDHAHTAEPFDHTTRGATSGAVE